MMMNKLLFAATAAAFALASGAALAQEDHNNPAPSYGKTAPVQAKVQHIQDGNNGAPRYPAATTSNSTAPTGTHATAKRRATHG